MMISPEETLRSYDNEPTIPIASIDASKYGSNNTCKSSKTPKARINIIPDFNEMELGATEFVNSGRVSQSNYERKPSQNSQCSRGSRSGRKRHIIQINSLMSGSGDDIMVK